MKEEKIAKIMEKICDDYCYYAKLCNSQSELDLACWTCPIEEMIRGVKNTKEK